MTDSTANPAVQSRSTLSRTWISVALAVTLLSPLASVPIATFASNQPWKVEFWSSLLLIVLIVWSYLRKDKLPAGLFSLPNKIFVPILALILCFAAWSGISLFWAQSAFTAAHHTLVWTLYSAYLVVFLGLLRFENGMRIITAAFAVIALIIGVSCMVDYLAIVDFRYSEGPIRVRYAKFAELLVTISPLLWAATLYIRGRRSSLFLFLAAAVSWITVMLSLSRGAFLSGTLGFIILFAGCSFFSIRKARRRTVVLAGIWLALTLAVQILFTTVSSIPSTTAYITGSADSTRSSANMRVFTWTVARQMAAGHWLAGVGADNFGIAFNTARADLAAIHPPTVAGEIAEDYMVERAHNEFLQIFAELGIVGILLFAASFGYFAFLTAKAFRQNSYRLSPVHWAAIAGMSAFFVSSMFSSFSFRSMQNGLVFFMIFAIAANELAKLSTTEKVVNMPSHVFRNPAAVLAAVFAVLMAIYSGGRGAAEYTVYRALGTPEFEESERIFRLATRLDPGAATAYLAFGQRCDDEGKHGLAASLVRQAIDRGGGITQTYSLLAKYQTLAGQTAAAIETLEEATRIFPRSVFMRVRYAVFLEEHAQAANAARQMDIARGIDIKQANGWHSIITEGSLAAFFKSQTDPQTTSPADLRPENAVRQYLDDVNTSHTGQSSPNEEIKRNLNNR